MKAYIQTDQTGNFYNVNAYLANEGFQSLGWETKKYMDAYEIGACDPETVIVGGIGNVVKHLERIGYPKSKELSDYPEPLTKYLGRKIWPSTFREFCADDKQWNCFIKPKSHTKKFTGKVIRSYADLAGLNADDSTELWCSELVNFRTEWRCFIRYGNVLDIRQYRGAWDSKLDLATVLQAVADFVGAPAAYALDFGIDERGQMRLVEFNDGHSLGAYGMGAINYAKFLSARWAELTLTQDFADF